ncbi:S-layer homology domain-containing protein [Bacillus litorisediminis]|uniref:S-layer homology domain-containing protein n=1 Tax=Bacillus litorisediminis TaxID=2922713 RepID=UPI001FAFE9E2|nr:S-layer homology domain-containing protein [Bacillus litorisediminis]
MAYQSKSYKKFVAGTVTAAVVASAVAPAAAADKTFPDAENLPKETKDAIYALVGTGVINGAPDGNFHPYDSITRGQTAEMLVKYLDDVDPVQNGGNVFADLSANHYHTPYAEALANAGILGGVPQPDGTVKFNAGGALTREQMAKILVNALGLEDTGEEVVIKDLDEAAADQRPYIKILAQYDLTMLPNGEFNPKEAVKRSQFALFLYRASQLDVAEETQVTEVTPVDGRTIQVSFNNAIDADTLKNAAGQDVITVAASEGARSAGTITQELSEDGKTLTLKAAAGEFFKGEYTVKVPFEVIKDVNGEFVKPVNQKVTVNDTVAPTLTSAKAVVGAEDEVVSSLTLTFDEEVASIGNVKINGTNHAAAVVSGNTATVSGLSLDVEDSYEVTVVNAKDTAGNVKEVQNTVLEVNVDSAAPAITNVEAVTEDTVKVTVSEALASEPVITGKIGTFTANVVKDVTVNSKNDKEYFVTLNSSYLFKNGNSDTVTLTVAADELEDAVGNKNDAEVSKTVVVTKDVIAPSVSKVDTTKDEEGNVTGFVVTFSEEVQSVNASKVSVVNSKGEILSFADVATAEVSAADAKKVIFTLKADVEVDQYSFELAQGFVSDKALTPNESAKASFTVEVTDATAPVATSFDIVSAVAADNVITVNFGTKVKATGTGSALNPAAYQVNGVTLPVDTDIEFVTGQNGLDQTQVKITLPEGFVKANDAKAIFRVSGVQSLDNKVSNSFIEEISVTDNTAPEAQSFVVTDLDEITVTYSEAIQLAADAVIGDEIKLFDAEGKQIQITGKAVSNGKLVLTIADATKVNELTTVASDTIDVKDAADNGQKAGITIKK